MGDCRRGGEEANVHCSDEKKVRIIRRFLHVLHRRPVFNESKI
jgi:hypothetical protein